MASSSGDGSEAGRELSRGWGGACLRARPNQRAKGCQYRVRLNLGAGDALYITWTEHGRSRERSTGTAEREQAETVFAEWMQRRGRRVGPSDPSTILITDVLNEYQEQRGAKVAAPGRVFRARPDRLLGRKLRRRCEPADLRTIPREARALCGCPLVSSSGRALEGTAAVCG